MRTGKRRERVGAETSLHREVYDSAEKLAVAFFVGLLLLVVGWFATVRTDGWLLGFPFVALGLWFMGMAAWRMLLISLPVIVLDAKGIFDRRVLPQVIPWAIVDVVTPMRSRYGVSGAMLLIGDRQLDALPLRPIRRALRPIGRLLGGPSGFAISALGTQLGGSELHSLCLAYSSLHKMQDEPANV